MNGTRKHVDCLLMRSRNHETAKASKRHCGQGNFLSSQAKIQGRKKAETKSKEVGLHRVRQYSSGSVSEAFRKRRDTCLKGSQFPFRCLQTLQTARRNVFAVFRNGPAATVVIVASVAVAHTLVTANIVPKTRCLWRLIVTIIFECSRPVIWLPSWFRSRIIYRFAWLLFGISILRIPFKEFAEKEYMWTESPSEYEQ